jgi:signal transduction histidine kinase
VASRSVLVVDDDPAVRKLLRRLLADDFSIVEAADGEEAVAVALAERPAVVLLDLHMPRLDGHGALLRIRAEPTLRTTPVLIVTGAATSGDDAATCLRDGAHDFVRKPFDDVELLARVRAAHRHKAFEEELGARNRELEAFASAAAHDLKEPLSGIARLLDVLELRHLDADKRGRIQDDMRTLAEQGSNLVADLLALAREDWATTALMLPVDVEDVVRTVVDAARLPDADVTVEGAWTKVVVPEVVLRSCLANLVSNADRYGRDDRGHLTLVVRGEVGDHGQVITVVDQGAGVHESVLDHLFEPFVTATDDAWHHPESTGLGLAVAARALERVGGTLALVPDVERGAAFRAVLPFEVI